MLIAGHREPDSYANKEETDHFVPKCTRRFHYGGNYVFNELPSLADDASFWHSLILTEVI